MSLNGGPDFAAGPNANFGVSGVAMPSSCSFDRLYVTATPTSVLPLADTIVVTLYKDSGGGPAAQTLTATVTSSTTQYTATTSSDTTHSFSVSAGNFVAIGITQSTTVPTVRLTVTTRCQ
jgi:hypothetical protein